MTLFKGRIWFCGLLLHYLKAVQVPARRTEEDKCCQTLLLSLLWPKCSAGAWGCFCHDKNSAAHTSPIPGTFLFIYLQGAKPTLGSLKAAEAQRGCQCLYLCAHHPRAGSAGLIHSIADSLQPLPPLQGVCSWYFGPCLYNKPHSSHGLAV